HTRRSGRFPFGQADAGFAGYQPLAACRSAADSVVTPIDGGPLYSHGGASWTRSVSFLAGGSAASSSRDQLNGPIPVSGLPPCNHHQVATAAAMASSSTTNEPPYGRVAQPRLRSN